MRSCVRPRLFCSGGTRTQTKEVVQFIDEHRPLYGVEPICRQVQIAPSTYYRHKALEAELGLRCQRYHQDEALKPEIMRVWQETSNAMASEKSGNR